MWDLSDKVYNETALRSSKQVFFYRYTNDGKWKRVEGGFETTMSQIQNPKFLTVVQSEVVAETCWGDIPPPPPRGFLPTTMSSRTSGVPPAPAKASAPPPAVTAYSHAAGLTYNPDRDVDV